MKTRYRIIAIRDTKQNYAFNTDFELPFNVPIKFVKIKTKQGFRMGFKRIKK